MSRNEKYIDNPAFSKCDHIVNYNINVFHPDPGGYYWQCIKCKKFGEDYVGSPILHDPAELEREFRKITGKTPQKVSKHF